MAKNKKRKRQRRKKRRSKINKSIPEGTYSVWRLICISILIVVALIAFVSVFGDGGYDSAYLSEIKRNPLYLFSWPGEEWRVLADVWGLRAAKYMRLQTPVGNLAGLLIIFGFATLLANRISRRLHRAVATMAVIMVASGAYMSVGANCAGGSDTSASISPQPQPGVVYFLDDHLGNTHLVVDSVGNIVHEESRYPYGVKKHEQNTAANSEAIEESKPYYSYTGKEYDEETGLVYFGGRYYSPELGRWITPDPLFLSHEIKPIFIKSPEEHNLYSYVGNNPINAIDEWGLELIGGQKRKSDGTTSIYFYDTDTASEYVYHGIKEPAPIKSPKTGTAYGPSAKLPPGTFELVPRPAPGGRILKEGSPVYTTPGKAPGVVIDPSGTKRTWIGPHVGTRSEGCPLFPPTKEGIKNKKSFHSLINFYENFGGTTITVEK